METPKAVGKYSFKGGATSMTHPFLKLITVDHLNGPKGDRFIKAIKHLDKVRLDKGQDKPGDGWFDRHIVVK